jgi:hypothetical protein
MDLMEGAFRVGKKQRNQDRAELGRGLVRIFQIIPK